jgi:hypothetical protein
MKHKILLFALMCGSLAVKAQDPVYLDGVVFIGKDDLTQWYGDVTLGPNAEVYIEDDAAALFYGKNMTIDPNAQFLSYPAMTQTGTGNIIFQQPNPNHGNLGQQTLNGGYSTGTQPSLLNLAVNNAAGLTLTGANTRVTNTTTLTNGHIFLADQNLVKDNDAVFSGTGASRYVVTNGTGHIVKEDLNSSFVFPVGRATADYTPATVHPSTTSTISVQVKNYTESAATINGSSEGMARAWHIYGSTATGGSITLQHNVATNGTRYNDVQAFVTQYEGSGVWASQALNQDFDAAGTHTRNSYTIPASSIADGGGFSKSSEPISPLPIKLISFDAYKKGEVAVLVWTTASEQNNHGFEIERSNDSKKWTKIGFVNSQAENGNGSIRLDYTFTDNSPQNGQNLYRLKQLDFDGKFEYSLIKTVVFENGNNISIYPNPTEGRVNITGLQGNEQIVIYDVSGRLLHQFKVASNSTTISLDEKLSSGTYQISIINADNQVSSYKVIKH